VITPSRRRALIVGIGAFEDSRLDLPGPAADADAIESLLSTNFDGTPNYDCRKIVDSLEDGDPISRAGLRQAIRELFDDFDGEVVFYFSGHGTLADTGGILLTSDAKDDDWGVPMEELAAVARESSASDVLVMIDACSSGDMAHPAVMGRGPNGHPFAVLRENMTVISASTAKGTALEAGGVGVFTAAVCDALDGGAADHMGWVSAPSLYTYVERRFGAWGQHPTYKTNATRVGIVRRCAPLIDRLKLRQLVELFPSADTQYQLDPEHEPEDELGRMHEPVNGEKVAIAQLMKDYRDAGLVKSSVPGEQFYWVARRGHSVELTDRGREYWWLVSSGKI
jgi:hypothetical protein